MQYNNKMITVFQTDYDRKVKANEKLNAIKNKQDQQYNVQEMIDYLEVLLQSTSYVEKSNNIIKNVSTNWEKKTTKGQYKNVNKVLNGLKEYGFYDVISGKKQDAAEMLKKTLSFNDINNMIHSEQKGGTNNESLYSFNQAYDYMQALKEKKGSSLFGFDLETTGGVNAEGIWTPDSITEYSMQEVDLHTGAKIKNDTVLIGITKEEGEKLKKEYLHAIDNGTIATNEKLRITASRYSLYGDDVVTQSLVKTSEGYYKVGKFIDPDLAEYQNINKVFAGIDKLVAIGTEMQNEAHLHGGIRADHRAVGESLSYTMGKINAEMSSLLGYNHLGHDIPIMQNQLLKWWNLYKDDKNIDQKLVNQIFNIDMDMKANQTLDVFGGIRSFLEYNEASKLYPGSNMQGVKKIAGQEYVVQEHLKQFFIDSKLQPHKAEDDVFALLGLATQKSELLKKQGIDKTVIEYIADELKTVDSTNTTLTPGKHVLRAKKRGASYGGKGYLNFAMDSQGIVYSASNHIIGKGDEVAEAFGGAVHENFNVGFGVNKGAFYELDKIQKIELNDKLRNDIGGLMPEYSGKHLYHVQLSMAVTENYKDTRLGDLKQNFFFKNEKEAQSFLSSIFDVVADKDENGNVIIRKQHLDKFDIREIQEIKGRPVFADVNKNHSKSHQELYDDALDFTSNKILTSRAENAFLRETSFDKLQTAMKLENDLLEFFSDQNIKKDHLSQRELNLIMSKRVSKGQAALGLDEAQLNEARKVITNALSKTRKVNDKEATRLLNSTVDNFSSIMSFVDQNKTILNTITSHLKDLIDHDASSHYKQEAFARTYDAVKREVAEHIYRNTVNNGAIKRKDILTDKTLQAPIHDFKNTYEIDFRSITKNSNVQYVSIAQPEELRTLQKFDIGTKSSQYALIDKAVQAVYGSQVGNVTDIHKQEAIEKLFVMLSKEDKLLRKTNAFKSIQNLGYNAATNEFDKSVNFLNIADAIVSGMQEVKSNDMFAGIKNLKQSFMKSLEGSEGFTRALNSEKVQDIVGDIAKTVVSDLNVSLITNENNSNIEAIVENMLMKHYAPSSTRVKNAKDWESKEMLFNKARADIKTYLTDVIKGYSSIKGTSISVQDDGALLIFNGGKDPIILNNLPKIGMHDESGTFYYAIGNQKFNLNRHLQLKSTNNGIVGDVGTNMSFINKYKHSHQVQQATLDHGVQAGLDKMTSLIKGDLKKLREQSTVNNFGGNDIDSNYNVDASEIKNVLKDLFAENGKYNSYIQGQEFADRKLIDTLQQKLAKATFNEYGELENLSPDIMRNIVKDLNHILNIIADSGNVTSDFKASIKNLSFTGQEKKVSNAIGYAEGSRPTNSTFGVFDNVQRPPITQSGNAQFLRVNDLDKAKAGKVDILSGNLISSAAMDKKTMREIAGVGKATTDVMLNTYYAGTSALQVLMNSNFNDVIENATAEYGSAEAAAKVYEHIKSTISTFEQERVMDSRTHEAIYGLQTARTQKLSKNIDIFSIVKELDNNDIKKQFDLITKHRGNFSLENGEIKFQSSVGTYVKRGEGTLKSKGFADLVSSFSSKMNEGVFNFNFYNSNGMKLRDSEINKIINENKSAFIKNNKLIDKELLPVALEKVLHEHGIKGQYVIEDVAALGYAKTMSSGSEKGMTDILYATTGRYNEHVKKVFENIGVWDSVKSKVLTNEAVDAYIETKKREGINVFEGTAFKSTAELKAALKEERHMHSKLLFEYALGGQAHLLANDNVVGHGNFGAMYQGSLSKAIELLAKHDKNGVNGAVDTIVDLINNNKEFQFMENWKLGQKGITKSHIGVSSDNGRLMINSDFMTSNNNVSNLNATKFNNLLKAIDAKLGLTEDSDDRLVRKNVYMLTVGEDGKEEYKLVKEAVGAYYSRNVNGKTVLLGAQTKENIKYVSDVETQTGATDEYFSLKKQSTDLKTKKIELERQLNVTDDPELRSELNDQLIRIKNKLRNTEDTLIDYEGTIKTMRFGDQEVSILNRIAITQSHVDKISDLMNDGQLRNDALDSYSLKGRISRDVDGSIINSTAFGLDNKITKEGAKQGTGIRVLDPFIGRLKQQQWYDEIRDVKLTKELVNTEDYKHLKTIFEDMQVRNLDIGVSKAEEVFQAKLAIAAKDFNKSAKTADDIQTLVNQGFEIKHIKDIAFDAEEVSTKNMIIDMGANFSEGGDSNRRYIAVPGTGKMVVDEEIRKKSHSDLISLRHRYDEYMSAKGNQKDSTNKVLEKINNLQDSIVKNVDAELFNKNAMLHNMSKVAANAPTYRNKLSGVVSNQFDDSLLKIDETFNFVSRNNEITKTAMIDGRSIADLEKDGIYHDYKFLSREQFENMGYFKQDTLKQFGFVDDEYSSAIEKMEQHLRTHGSIDIFDRYPNTRSGSLTLTNIFLDDTLTNNQSKISIPTAMKSNADNDGDSGSNMLIRKTDKDGRVIDGAYYTRVRELAIEDLKAQGKEITADSIVEAAVATGKIHKEDFEEFHKIQASMRITAMSDNQYWANEGKKIIAKDNLKNIKTGNIANASMVENAYSDFLGTNTTAKLSIMPSLEEFNAVEKEANEIIKKSQELLGSTPISNFVSDFTGSKLEKETDAWNKFANIADIRETASPEAMDKALAVLEQSVERGLIDSDYLSQAQSIAIKKIGHDRYAQEMMAKTGLAATGNVNLVLNSIKLATAFRETDPSKIAFTNFIWEGLDTAEQQIISSKKAEGNNYDNDKVESFSDAMRKIYKGDNVNEGIDGLEKWMDKNGGEVFEVAYEKLGKNLLNKNTYANIKTTEQGAKEMKRLFLDYIRSSTKDNMFMSTVHAFDAIGRNGNHDFHIDQAKAAAHKSDFFSSSTLNTVGLSSKSRYEAIMQREMEVVENITKAEDARRQLEEAASRFEQGIVKNSGDIASTAMKHMPKINVSGGGLGMAVLGTAAGLMISGYASGNPLRDKQASEVAQQQPQQTMSVPQFMEQGGMVTGNSQSGYIINLQADTKKGKKYMKKMMAQAAEASVGGAVSVNMNLRDMSRNGVTDQDIENFMNRYL